MQSATWVHLSNKTCYADFKELWIGDIRFGDSWLAFLRQWDNYIVAKYCSSKILLSHLLLVCSMFLTILRLSLNRYSINCKTLSYIIAVSIVLQVRKHLLVVDHLLNWIEILRYKNWSFLSPSIADNCKQLEKLEFDIRADATFDLSSSGNWTFIVHMKLPWKRITWMV